MLHRARIWEILDVGKPGDRPSRAFDLGLIVLIVLNVIEVLLSSVKSINDQYGTYLYAFEVFSVAAFSIEYVARIWSCTSIPKYSAPLRGRLRFFFRPLILIDLFAIVPFYLPFLGIDLRVIRIFRIFRVLRILKLARYSNALHIMRYAIVGKKEELVLTAVVLGVLLLVSASLMFFAEGEAQPDVFSSIPAALWWSVVTLTTVGYGDVYPITTLGKVIAGVISILGIGMVALPAGLVSAGFVEQISNVRKSNKPRTGICPTCGRNYDDD